MTYPELSLVRLTREVEGFPAGTVGTVMHAYADGLAYEVEFPLAYSLPVTVRAEDLCAYE